MRESAREIGQQSDSVSIRTAQRLFELADSVLVQAQALDPTWIEPTLARGWLALERTRVALPPDWEEWARHTDRFADAALRLAPGDAAALELRGRIFWARTFSSTHDPSSTDAADAAERYLRAALAADPSRASAWITLSELLRYRGLQAEAAYAAEQALAKDAFMEDADRIFERLYRIRLQLGQLDEATRWCAEGLRRFPNNWRLVECHLTILSYLPPSAAAPDSSRRLLRELERLDPAARSTAARRTYQQSYRLLRHAIVLARAGQPDSARAILASARHAAGSDSLLHLSLDYDEASLRLALGEREAARALIRRYLAARPEFTEYARRDPQLAGLW